MPMPPQPAGEERRHHDDARARGSRCRTPPGSPACPTTRLNSAPKSSSQITGCTSVMTINHGWRSERAQRGGRSCSRAWRSGGGHRVASVRSASRERAAGVAQVDVVERGAGDGDGGDGDARALERGEDGRAPPRAPSSARARSVRPSTVTLAHARRRAPSARGTPPSPAASRSSTWMASPRSSALSASGVPSATTRPRSTIASCDGEPVGLLEVVGGEQDGQALLAREPRRSPPTCAARTSGSRPVVGSSRNSTRGRCTRPMATSSRRCMPPE